MKVLLRSAFNRYTGYGNDGIDIARFLDRAGVDVVPWPASSVMPGVPMDFAKLLTKTAPRGDHAYDATIQFMPPFNIRVGPTQSKRTQGLPVNIAPLHYGWSMWEKSQLTRFDMSGHGVGQGPWRRLTAMYATTDVSIEAFRFYDPKPEYRLLPCGIDPDGFEVQRRLKIGPTRFVMVGELHIRKDPWVAIEAFRKVKKEHPDAEIELHLKTNVPGLHPGMAQVTEGLHIHAGHWPYNELIDWLGSMTCYVGPSRGEGNLKPPMEFMATGGPVIATYWSGPTNWLTPDTGWPLDYQLMPLDPKQPDGPLEARADVDHLADLMWHVHTHRDEAIEKGLNAADHIREVASWEGIIAQLVKGIEADAGRLDSAP